MANANAITNPNNLIDVSLLNYFEGKMAAKYQTQAISAISGLNAETVEGAIAELLGKILALPSAIIPKGTRTFSQLAPSTDLVAASIGFMWNISDGFTTTSDFAEGSGHVIPAGANVYVANVGTAQSPSYKYDIFNGMYDLSIFKTIDSLKSKGAANKGVYFDADGNAQAMTYEVNKSVPSDAVFTDTTYESLEAASGGQDVSLVTTGEKYLWNDKYDLPSGGIPKTDLASAVQDSLNLADTAIQSVKSINGTTLAGSGDITLAAYIEANPMALTADQLAALKSGDIVIKTTGNEKHSYVVVYKDDTKHEVALVYTDVHTVEEIYYEQDGSGNWKAALKETVDLDKFGDFKVKQTAVTDPTASGTSLTFIANITQNENGVITPQKKTVQVASTSDIDEIFA